MTFKDLEFPSEKININHNEYILKIAATKRAKQIGLSLITYLPPNTGLFFWYGNRRYPNSTDKKKSLAITMCVPFNLTVIFLLKSGQIVHIFNNLKAEKNNNIKTATKYYCPVPADLMIELPGQTNLQLAPGQNLDINKIIKNQNLQFI